MVRWCVGPSTLPLLYTLQAIPFSISSQSTSWQLSVKSKCYCGSPPGVMMADTLSFNAKGIPKWPSKTRNGIVHHKSDRKLCVIPTADRNSYEHNSCVRLDMALPWGHLELRKSSHHIHHIPNMAVMVAPRNMFGWDSYLSVSHFSYL